VVQHFDDEIMLIDGKILLRPRPSNTRVLGAAKLVVICKQPKGEQVQKIAVVTTTIREPVFLSELSENAARNKKTDLFFYVIGDKKTPSSARELCESLAVKYPSFNYTYYDIDGQEESLSSYSELMKIVPYNSGVRKLLGNRIAYDDGCDITIQIDDDNFVGGDDFIGAHSKVGTVSEVELFASDNGWHNVYEHLIEENGLPFFPRGYPWSKRDYQKEARITKKVEARRVVVNNGLVYEDPDIDAISRLFWPVRVVGVKSGSEHEFGLFPGTWCSFNNQNTSTSRELTQVYFTPVAGQRNADIWTSFVICKLVEQTGDVVMFGNPFVKQFRNEHNLWVDLEDEFLSNKATDAFVALLDSIELTKESYKDLLDELLQKSLNDISCMENIEENQLEMMQNFFMEYKVWSDSFK
jgi:hypothetical protein